MRIRNGIIGSIIIGSLFGCYFHQRFRLERCCGCAGENGGDLQPNEVQQSLALAGEGN